MSVRPCLFLDRDGVINHDYGYVYEHEYFDFIDGIFDLTRYACQRKYKLVVITNQAGIARGYYTEEQFHQLTEWMCQRFSAEGAPISKVYFAPYHPTAGGDKYRKDDWSRKPNPGMILQAQKDLAIDLSLSILIGDKFSDIQAGNAAGVGTSLLLAPGCPTELNGLNYQLINNLREAKKYLGRGV
jgi:D-glycero-D-manno-heptose 1,7-bisphosphate phosphatase